MGWGCLGEDNIEEEKENGGVVSEGERGVMLSARVERESDGGGRTGI